MNLKTRFITLTALRPACSRRLLRRPARSPRSVIAVRSGQPLRRLRRAGHGHHRHHELHGSGVRLRHLDHRLHLPRRRDRRKRLRGRRPGPDPLHVQGGPGPGGPQRHHLRVLSGGRLHHQGHHLHAPERRAGGGDRQLYGGRTRAGANGFSHSEHRPVPLRRRGRGRGDHRHHELRRPGVRLRRLHHRLRLPGRRGGRRRLRGRRHRLRSLHVQGGPGPGDPHRDHLRRLSCGSLHAASQHIVFRQHRAGLGQRQFLHPRRPGTHRAAHPHRAERQPRRPPPWTSPFPRPSPAGRWRTGPP